MEITAAGLYGILTRFPFHSLLLVDGENGETKHRKGRKKIVNLLYDFLFFSFFALLYGVYGRGSSFFMPLTIINCCSTLCEWMVANIFCMYSASISMVHCAVYLLMVSL